MIGFIRRDGMEDSLPRALRNRALNHIADLGQAGSKTLGSVLQVNLHLSAEPLNQGRPNATGKRQSNIGRIDQGVTGDIHNIGKLKAQLHWTICVNRLHWNTEQTAIVTHSGAGI